MKIQTGRTIALVILLILALVTALPGGGGIGAAAAGAKLGDRTLHKGMTGDDVRVFQRILTSLDFPTGGVTGYFGPGTLKALKAYQKDRGLTPDGIAGRLTFRQIAADGEKPGDGSAAQPVNAKPKGKTGPREHLVSAGENLSTIAARYGTDVKTLADANRLKSPDRIFAGQKLLIPQKAPEPAREQAQAKPKDQETPLPPSPDQGPIVYSPPAGGVKRIALTFDDGPDPTLTPKILDTLAKHGAKATFFVIGREAQKYPDLAKEIAAQGHEIASHSYAHTDLTRVSEAAIKKDLATSVEVIKSLGATPRFYRPPAGAYNEAIDLAVRELGLTTVLWVNIGGQDLPAGALVRRTVASMYDGAIILLYSNRQTTVDALDQIISTAENQGYKPVILSELLGTTNQAN